MLHKCTESEPSQLGITESNAVEMGRLGFYEFGSVFDCFIQIIAVSVIGYFSVISKNFDSVSVMTNNHGLGSVIGYFRSYRYEKT